MSTRIPALISAMVTVVLLILFAVLFLFFQMIALNGASERQGFTAMGVSLLCQGVVAILAAFLSARLTTLAITKWNWNNILAVIVAIAVGTFAGGLLSFLSVIIAIPIAGIR
jgi:formate hydrogenlyase subunit 4